MAKHVLLTNNIRIATETQSTIQSLFMKFGKLCTYKKNAYVFYEEEDPTHIYYLKKGLIKVCQSTLEGVAITFSLRKQEDVFGFAEVMLDKPRVRIAQCLDDCQIWVLDARIFLEHIESTPIVLKEFFKISVQRLLKQQHMVELLVTQTVSSRLAWLLRELSSPQKHGHYVFEGSLTHMEISNLIGCSRQKVTETLSRWKEQNLVSYNRKSIIIKHIEKLN